MRHQLFIIAIISFIVFMSGCTINIRSNMQTPTTTPTPMPTSTPYHTINPTPIVIYVTVTPVPTAPSQESSSSEILLAGSEIAQPVIEKLA